MKKLLVFQLVIFVFVNFLYQFTLLTSKTVGKGEQGRNELTMSNLPGKEQIYLKAEKDYDELVQHDYSQTILNNKTSKQD